MNEETKNKMWVVITVGSFLTLIIFVVIAGLSGWL